MIESWLERKSICICAGSGGVGKTTTSAAIALGMAARGKKVAVLTIDPAKRLAGALGLPELGNEERRVEADVDGELWAMMLDAKRTFDDLIEWHAPDERTRDAVLSNRIYQELSNAVAGLAGVHGNGKAPRAAPAGPLRPARPRHPPTRNALDFIDAPKKLAAFIDSRSLQFFTAPGFFGLKVFGRGTGMLFSVMKRATGIDLLEDLSEFFRSFGDMAAGFRERADGVNRLLADSRTAFVLVTSPSTDAIDEAAFFHHRLLDAGLPFAGIVANRVRPELPAENGAGAELEEMVGGELAAKVLASFEDERRLAARDQANLEQPAQAPAPQPDDRGSTAGCRCP